LKFDNLQFLFIAAPLFVLSFKFKKIEIDYVFNNLLNTVNRGGFAQGGVKLHKA
jgi:hypothetical protein